jgi:hypothetical protein
VDGYIHLRLDEEKQTREALNTLPMFGENNEGGPNSFDPAGLLCVVSTFPDAASTPESDYDSDDF